MKIPYADLGTQIQEIKSELENAFSKVVDSGHYVMGPHLKSFEEIFARYCGTKYSVGVATGTAALNLVWRTIELGDDDEVITTPHSYIATASAIAMTGAKPVFADIGADLNIDPSNVESIITSKTKAICAVHLTGRPAKMDLLRDIANRYNLFLLEDAAQAVGAKYHGKRTGSMGDASGFSLHALKNLFAFGDGGMITTNNESLKNSLLQARNHGHVDREQIISWSPNERLDELQAALLEVCISKLDDWTESRRQKAFRYNEALRNYVTVPDEGDGEYCVYQTYVLQSDQRDELQEFLQSNGITALVHYRNPIHIQPCAEYLGYVAEDLPETMKACNRILSLPLFPTMTDEQQDYVIEKIIEFYK